MPASLNAKSQAVLEKAFEVAEISQRRDELLQEFEGMLIGDKVSVPRKTSKFRRKAKVRVVKNKKTSSKKRLKKKVVRSDVRYPTKQGDKSKADRIMSVMKKKKGAPFTAPVLAKRIKEPDNVAAVSATLHIMARKDEITRVEKGIFTVKK